MDFRHFFYHRISVLKYVFFLNFENFFAENVSGQISDQNATTSANVRFGPHAIPKPFPE